MTGDARLTRALQRRDAMVRVARHFAAEGDARKVLAELMKEAVAAVGGDDGAIAHWDEPRGTLAPVQSLASPPRAVTLDLERSASGRAVRQRAPVIVNDYQRELGPVTPAGELGARAVVAAPLLHEGRLLGAISVRSFAPKKQFTLEDAEALELLASIAAATLVGLERARLAGALLAARTAQRELNDQLTRTMGYAELLARDSALPAHLRETARNAADGAAAAAEILIRLRQITQIQELDWGESGEPTIDLTENS